MSFFSVLDGDCIQSMKELPDCIINTCVTSPPYFGLRDYGCDGQIGLEETPDAFVKKIVEVFREVKRVLRDDGTLWLNLGDSYYNYRPGKGQALVKQSVSNTEQDLPKKCARRGNILEGLKEKDLIGIPWRVAFALQADGWYLRQDIIWHKPNPMPESVTDRCTKAHEYIFLLSKSAKYYFDNEAIKEPLAASSVTRLSQPNLENQKGSDRVPGKTNGNMKAVRFGGNKYGDDDSKESRTKSGNEWENKSGTRNRRSVWTVTTKPYKGAHFATFPPDLIEPCILAGCPVGGIVLDPFGGSGTTAMVARNHGRKSVLCELNEKYIRLAMKRIEQGVLL